MLPIAMNSKVIKIMYEVILPVAVVLLLFGIASFNSRPQLLGSASADFIIRFMLTLWFCGLYIRLSRFSSFSFFPNKKWSKSDVGGIEKYFYIAIPSPKRRISYNDIGETPASSAMEIIKVLSASQRDTRCHSLALPISQLDRSKSCDTDLFQHDHQQQYNGYLETMLVDFHGLWLKKRKDS